MTDINESDVIIKLTINLFFLIYKSKYRRYIVIYESIKHFE